MNGKYRLVRQGPGGTERTIVEVFATFAAGAAALRKAGQNYFLQGPSRAWWYDEVTKTRG